MRIRFLMPALGLGAALALAAPAAATPVQWTVSSGGNDHWYELVTSPLTWASAVTAANAMVLNDQAGYLATVASSAEQTFINTLYTNISFWLGGTDAGTEGQWEWATEPGGSQPFGFTFWNAGEPNNVGNEDCLIGGQFGAGGTWNDGPCSFNLAYMVEWEPEAPTSAVPLPAGLPLLAGALGLLVALRRRARA